MGRITKNYLYNVAYQLLVFIAPIITAPYLARVLGASKLGIYSYVSSSGNIIATLSLLGIYAYGNRQTAYVRDQKDMLTQTFWEIMLSRLFLGLICTAIYLVYAFANREFTWFFVIYYPFILAQIIDCSWVFVGLENMKPAVLKNLFAKITTIIGIFVLVRSEEDIGLYIILIAITTFIATTSVYSQLPKYIERPKVERHNVIHHIRGSTQLFLPQVASLFYLQIDKVMIQWLTGSTAQLSFYDQAEKLINIPLSLISVMSTVVMPRIANEYKKGNQKEIQTILIRTGRYALLMAFPLMFGLLCVAQQFVPWYLGTGFLPTATTMMILSPIVCFNTLAGISGSQYFTATNQIHILLKAYASAAILNIAVNIALIPHFGCTGAAVATVISSAVSVVLQYYYLSKQMEIKVLFKYSVRYFAGAAVMGIVLYFCTAKMANSPLTTLIQIAVGAGIYLIYLLVINDTAPNEIIMIAKELRRKQ